MSIGLIFPSASAHAGLFDALAPERASAEEKPDSNSQNLALLQAVLSPDLVSVSEEKEIKIDSSALVPESGPLGTAEDKVVSDKITVYTVHDGDTVSGIAKMFDVSASTIRWANNLSANAKLKKDQVITILPINGVAHTVAKGDTLKSIAKKYKADSEEIISFNDLSKDSVLAIGDELIIPDGEFTAPTPKATGSARASSKLYVNPATLPDYSGDYIFPVPGGRLTQHLHGKNGADIGNRRGAEIVAVASGKVIVDNRGGYGGGYGTYLVIAHENGTQTLYAHNSKNVVTVGDRVSQGETIAYMGSTGHSTGPHLHFEIRGAKNPFNKF